jgi:DNA-binding XRE family transcriptional regulator
MLELTKKLPTENATLLVTCGKSKLAKVKAALSKLECKVRLVKPRQTASSEAPAMTVSQKEAPEKEWYAIEELFPESAPGRALRAYRSREDMTQKQTAEAVGISVQNLSHMENGRRPIGKEMAKRLAKVLHTDWRLLLS